MPDQYVKFRLVPGQSAPDDGNATGIGIGDDWIVWVGPENSFPTLDPHSKRPLIHEIMNEDDIEKFEIIKNKIFEDDEIEPPLEDLDPPNTEGD